MPTLPQAGSLTQARSHIIKDMIDNSRNKCRGIYIQVITKLSAHILTYFSKF